MMNNEFSKELPTSESNLKVLKQEKHVNQEILDLLSRLMHRVRESKEEELTCVVVLTGVDEEERTVTTLNAHSTAEVIGLLELAKVDILLGEDE